MNPQHRERLVEMRSGGVPAETQGGEEGAPPASGMRAAAAPPASGTRSAAAPGREPTPPPPVPFRPEDVHLLLERWVGVQNGFIENPRRAVQQADHLVGEILERLLGVIDSERTSMRCTLDKGVASTEELRLAMRRYRALFDLLLTL